MSSTKPVEGRRLRLDWSSTGRVVSVTKSVVEILFEFPDASFTVKTTSWEPISVHENDTEVFCP